MIRLGLIGLGQAAQILHIPNIEKMENKFEITAVADISKNLTNYIADKYRVPHRFTNGMDLIGCPDVDAVMIMSPGDHAEFAIAALEAGSMYSLKNP
ncbi:MAG: Gfo/Idh/MocA family protein [Dysosmobacter sp.]